MMGSTRITRNIQGYATFDLAQHRVRLTSTFGKAAAAFQ